MAPKASPPIRSVLRSGASDLATIASMRDGIVACQAATEQSRVLIDESWAAVARANDLLSGRSRPPPR
jgi:hypothetical protein